MTIKLGIADHQRELKPRIVVVGIGGAGGNAVNNMIRSSLAGVEFMVANTDAQSLQMSEADSRIQLGLNLTHGLGAGSRPDIGRAAAEEALDDIMERLAGAHMAFITAGMGGGTGTGAAPVIARAAREHGVLTVGVVTKPFHFEGSHRMRLAEQGIEELSRFVDTLIIVPNQNLFRVANEKTTFADAFKMADDVLYAGVRGVTDLMLMPGLINLDFADIRAVMSEMGKAMMGTGEAEGDNRAKRAAEAAISNPLLDDMSMKGARGMLINISGGKDMTLFEADEAANRVRDEVDPEANIIFGATFDDSLAGKMRVSVVATGIDVQPNVMARPTLEPISRFRVIATAGSQVPAQPNGGMAFVPPVHVPASAIQPVAHGVEAARASLAPQTDGALALSPQYAEPQVAEEPPPPLEAAPAAARPEPVFDAAMMEPAPKAPQLRAETAPAPAPQPTEARRRGGGFAGFFSRLTGSGRGQRRRADAEPRVERPAEPPADARLSNLSPADRLAMSKPEEDLLDIPAFLRRQAN
jgi:cell division protein FtsZ